MISDQYGGLLTSNLDETRLNSTLLTTTLSETVAVIKISRASHSGARRGDRWKSTAKAGLRLGVPVKGGSD